MKTRKEIAVLFCPEASSFIVSGMEAQNIGFQGRKIILNISLRGVDFNLQITNSDCIVFRTSVLKFFFSL